MIQFGDCVALGRHLSEARDALDQAAVEWQSVGQRVPRDQLLHSHFRKTAPYGYLGDIDISELRAGVEDLWSRREALIAAHTIPSWFESTCRT